MRLSEREIDRERNPRARTERKCTSTEKRARARAAEKSRSSKIIFALNDYVNVGPMYVQLYMLCLHVMYRHVRA